jgi:hypothetical protein
VRDSSTARPSRVSHLAWISEWNKKQKPFVCYSSHADAIRRALAEKCRYVGFEVVVVHAIDSDAVAFYAQRGFTQFEDHELHLFMPVKNLLATLET